MRGWRRWRVVGAADRTGVCAGDDAGGLAAAHADCRETENRALAGCKSTCEKTARQGELRGPRAGMLPGRRFRSGLGAAGWC
jgi:hypothetical protein